QQTWRRSSHVPHGRNVIGYRWVFAKKRAADGAILRYKARLVAQGFSQLPGVDYGATFAPVMSADAMRFTLPLAAEFDFEVHQMDVVTAYLNAPLTDPLWMRAPPGPFGFEDCAALHLLKAIYGLKQGAYLWHLCLRSWLLSDGFRATIRLSQPHYIDDLLARFRMSDAWPVQTPSCPGAPTRSAARPPATTAEAAKMAGNPLRELVGAVLYLAVTTRPDIFDEVRSLTRTVHNPRLPDCLAAPLPEG
ncbi:unnamed protein product, partial [Phaeothamnion confervicola]